ncbi:MAG: hypothetical protein HUU06_03420 [Planctomycetaceae bacterium]|nr:hypothetical protein [Planctomycetaceae bacterium]
MKRDLHNAIEVRRGISPVISTDDTPVASQIIDRQGFDALEFVIQTGVIDDANATFAVLVEDGDDSGLSDAAAVADAELLGTEAGAAFTYANDNVVRKIGYAGRKRYVRLTITPTGNSANAVGALLAAVVILSKANRLPTS